MLQDHAVTLGQVYGFGAGSSADWVPCTKVFISDSMPGQDSHMAVHWFASLLGHGAGNRVDIWLAEDSKTSRSIKCCVVGDWFGLTIFAQITGGPPCIKVQTSAGVYQSHAVKVSNSSSIQIPLLLIFWGSGGEVDCLVFGSQWTWSCYAQGEWIAQ